MVSLLYRMNLSAQDIYSDRLNVSIVFKSTAQKNDDITTDAVFSKTHFGWPRVHYRHLNILQITG